MKKHSTSIEILSHKRERKRLRRVLILRFRSKTEANKLSQDLNGSLEQSNRKPRLSKTLHWFLKQGSDATSRKKLLKSAIRVKVPKEFSLISNPVESLSVLHNLATQYSRRSNFSTLNIDHSSLREYDLGAEKTLDHLVDQIKFENRGKTKFKIKGSLPTAQPAKSFVCGVGVIRTLGADDQIDQTRKYDIFDQVDYNPSNSADGSGQAETKDIAVNSLVSHINGCLDGVDRCLSNKGIDMLSEAAAEALDNAVQHSTGNNWAIASYLDTNTPEYTCELVIFNFGKSIAQTFEALPDDHFTRKLVNPYIDKHKHRNLFSHKWRRQDLLTLIALQERISSKNEQADDTRGIGTINLIDFFQKLFDEVPEAGGVKPVMAILSGETHVLFDGKYKLSPDAEGRRVIAFNESNSLAEKPDPRHFTSLSEAPFPGTIICIKFSTISQTKLRSAP